MFFLLFFFTLTAKMVRVDGMLDKTKYKIFMRENVVEAAKDQRLV